jgi:phenylacetate-CoA ligase
MSFADQVYQSAPGWMQSVLLNGHALRLHRQRFGPAFRTMFAEWDASQWWDRNRLRAQQDDRVRALVRFAGGRVPFYGRRWADHGVNVGQVQGVADLAVLPTIDKAEIRRAGRDMFSVPPEQLTYGHTSGTTGSPLRLRYDRDMVIANNVADWRQKRWGGLELGDWCAIFLGRVVVRVEEQRPPFWRANHIQKQLWCSSFHLSEEKLPLYVAELRRRAIPFIEGYPSTLYILASYLLRRGERLTLRGAFTSSETLHAVQREAIEEAFGCPVFDFYGHAERVIFAGECDQHGGKHLSDEYGVTELLDDDGQPVPEGQPGMLTGTTLWNRGMPLIRYRTGDVSARSTSACRCGRGLGKLADVATKAEDIVVTPDGRYLSPSVLTHPFKPINNLLKSQIIQDASDHVLIKVQPTQGWSDADRTLLEAGLRPRLGPAMHIEIRLVDEIPVERSGKFRWVICELPHACLVDWET